MDTLVSTTGWVGTPVDFKVTRNGVSLASFRLAMTPRINRNGEWCDGPTTWLPVTCFRTLAERVHDSIAKGEPVIVIGKLRTNTWVNAQGEERERAVLEATTVGHDLTRGTSRFKKYERLAVVENDEVAEMIDEQADAVSTDFGSNGPRELRTVSDDDLRELVGDMVESEVSAATRE